MKKNNIFFGSMILILLIVSGCRKIESDVLSGVSAKGFKGLKKSVLSPFSVQNNEYSTLGSLGSALERRKMDGEGFDGPPVISGTYRTGELIGDFGTDPNKVMYIESFKSNVFVVSPEMGLNIFPGAILNGNSIQGDVFAPRIIPNISANIRPVNLSTNLPVSGSKVAKTVMARPSSDRAFVRTALKDLDDLNPGKTGAARLQFEMSSFSNYDMIKTFYGYNKNLDLFLYKQDNTTTGGSQSVTRNTGFILKFYQQNFTVDVDVPSDYSELFDPTGLDTAAVFGGKSPYYVSSVTYGRMGIMTIESSSDSAAVYTAVTKQIGILQGIIGAGASLSDSEKQILASADIKYAITGPSGDRNVSDLKTITSLAGFVEVLSSNSTYSMDDPGVPISFRLRYLVDDTNVEAPFQIKYGPFDKPYARIEYNNAESQVSASNRVWTYEITTADIFVRLYRDPSCTFPVGGFNFLTFNYREVETKEWYKEESFIETTVIANRIGTIKNNSKGSSFRYSSKKNIGFIMVPDVPSNTPGATKLGYSNRQYTKLTLENGNGYRPISSNGFPF